jgi:hypothetical protein
MSEFNCRCLFIFGFLIPFAWAFFGAIAIHDI